MSREVNLGKIVPERGIDYYTNEDISEMVQTTKTEVLSEISIPKKTSDLTNDSGFIDKSVNDLTNYYDKTNLYTKTEIDSKISSVYKYKGSVATYQDLPSSGLTIGDVYNVESDGSNYAWNGTVWDKLGGDVDLSNYYNKTQTDTLLSGKVDNSTLNDYYTKTRADELLATKVDTTTLTDYVKNTDYATGGKGGVIKIGSAYGTEINSSGIMYPSLVAYSNYANMSNYAFIGKGTLENVITGKELVNKTYVDGLVGDINDALDLLNGEVI